MVYVDSAINVWKSKKWCHLTADSISELHDFAARLNLKREWFQDTRIPHYDITASKREKALAIGATALTTKEMISRVQQILQDKKS